MGQYTVDGFWPLAIISNVPPARRWTTSQLHHATRRGYTPGKIWSLQKLTENPANQKQRHIFLKLSAPKMKTSWLPFWIFVKQFLRVLLECFNSAVSSLKKVLRFQRPKSSFLSPTKSLLNHWKGRCQTRSSQGISFQTAKALFARCCWMFSFLKHPLLVSPEAGGWIGCSSTVC